MVIGETGRLGVVGCSILFAGVVAGFVLGSAASGPWASAETPAKPLPVVPLVSSGETVVGETIVYPAGSPAKITAAVVTIPPGAETGLHRHGVPTFGYMLEGELTVDYGDRGLKVLKAGDALLEAVEVAHNGRNTGESPVRILAVFMGAEGRPTTIPAK